MSEPRRLNTEQDHHKRAFELYLSLGLSRSYQRVADQLNVSVSAVKTWSRSFRWSDRIHERDAEAARQVADRTLGSRAAETERNLKIVRAALLRLAKGIAEGKVRMQMGDLDRLVKLEEYLSKDRSDSPSWIRHETDMEVLKARAREIVEELALYPKADGSAADGVPGTPKVAQSDPGSIPRDTFLGPESDAANPAQDGGLQQTDGAAG